MTAPTLLEAISAARAKEQHTVARRSRGEAGYAEVASARYRTELAIQRAVDAGLLVRTTQRGTTQ